MAKTIGVEVNFLTPDELKTIWPLCNVEGVLGAIQHPDDGYIQPADLTQAFAKGARAGGAEIYRNTVVTAISRTSGGEWCVHTDQGDITCEHVVAATGNFARKTGEMVGLDVPVIPVEHQYIVTEPHPAIQARRAARPAGDGRAARIRRFLLYARGGERPAARPLREGRAVLLRGRPSAESEYELFQGDLERLEPYLEAAIARVPAFGEVGVKKVYNGAIAYTPDGSPIVGPAWGLKNFWLCEGHSFGITAAGGSGWQLAEWIVDGEPTVDMMGVDPRRFGDYASRGYLKEKNEEAYAKVFTVHYPDEERAAGRPLKRAPCYDRMKARGAVFGTVYGWERPNWFAPPGYALSEEDLAKSDVLLNENHPPVVVGEPIRERWSFRRSNYFPIVGAECRHVHEKVGVLDMSAFAKFRVSGPGARAWLDRLFTNKLPAKVGRVSLTYLLTDRGGVRSEFTVFREALQRRAVLSGLRRQRSSEHDWDYYLVKAAADRRQSSCETGEDHHSVRRARGRRPPLARAVGQADRRRPLQRRLPLAYRQADQYRRRTGHGAAGQLRRRAGLGAASPDRDAELSVRPAVRGR